MPTLWGTSSLAQSVLDEARNIYDARSARLERIHARATTLQGTVAIATSLVVATAALLLDPNTFGDHRELRRTVAVVLGLLVFCLVMTGYMAASAALRTSERARRRTRGILERFEQGGTEPVMHLRLQTIDLLVAAEKNKEIDLRRSAILQCARRWYRIALALILVLAALLVAAAYNDSAPGNASPSTTGATKYRPAP